MRINLNVIKLILPNMVVVVVNNFHTTATHLKIHFWFLYSTNICNILFLSGNKTPIPAPSLIPLQTLWFCGYVFWLDIITIIEPEQLWLFAQDSLKIGPLNIQSWKVGLTGITMALEIIRAHFVLVIMQLSYQLVWLCFALRVCSAPQEQMWSKQVRQSKARIGGHIHGVVAIVVVVNCGAELALSIEEEGKVIRGNKRKGNRRL